MSSNKLTNREQIIEVLKSADGPVSCSDLAERIDPPYQSVVQMMGDLYESGVVDREGAGVRGSPYRYTWTGEGVRTDGRISKRDEVAGVLKRAREPLTADEIAERVDSTYQTCNKYLKILNAESEVERTGRGVRGTPYRYHWSGSDAETGQEVGSSLDPKITRTGTAVPLTLESQPNGGRTWETMDIEPEDPRMVATVDDTRYTFTGSDVDMVLVLGELADDQDSAWEAVRRYGEKRRAGE